MSDPAPQIPRWKKGRVRTPTLIQMEAVECGAAALGIVLGYYGRFEPLEVLREACGVSRDGSKASNILKAARRFGLEGKGYRLEIADLADLSLPIIIFWNFNHFLVLEGIRGDKVYLNDPAKGPRVVSFEEFDDCFTGVALDLSKGPDFKASGQKSSIWPSLRRRLQGCRKALIFIMLCALFMVIPGLVIPFFSQIFIDYVLVEGLDGWFKPLLLAMVVAATLQACLVFIQKLYLLRLETKLALKGTSTFMQRILTLPVSFFYQRMPGDLTSRAGLNDQVSKVLAQQVAPNIINFFMMLFYLAVMVQYDWVLSITALLMAALNFLALSVVSERKKNLSQKILHEHNKLMGQAMSGLQLIETLKASGSESDFFARWAGYQAKSINARQEFSRINQYLGAVSPLLTAINNACILGIGGFRIIAGDLTIGQLVAFQFLVGMFNRPVIQLVDMGSTLQNTFADMAQLDDVLRYEPDPMVMATGKETTKSNTKSSDWIPEDQPLKLSGKLELKNVTFGYSKLEKPLIRDFNLKLSPGTRVALVGSSGSGKSTIAKVVTGLYPAWEGDILFDDTPITDLHRHAFIRSVASVDQDIFLFDGTIRANLTMWNETIPEKTLIQAAQDAQIHTDIMMRPGGFDAWVEEGGRNFSGGQGQRLEIARALAGNPAILILDEATSALDPETEQRVDEAIRRRGCTCLIIAHRLSTIRDADEIIVLSKGEVVQRGTHDELKNSEGLYATLIAAQ